MFFGKSADLERRIEELEEENARLKKSLIHDSLTGVNTRAFFQTEVGTYLEAISRGQNADEQRREKFGFRTLSLLFIDVDHFKNINDTFGHDVGDKVLQTVAETLATNLRTEDTIARWGGEEFVVSLLGADEISAKYKAEELRERIEKISFPNNPNLKLSISVGVVSSEVENNLAKLVSRADKAMYAAKHTGRNKVVAYSELDKIKLNGN